jgi:hypothetical protein
VSSFALIRSTPINGSPTHSRHPMTCFLLTGLENVGGFLVGLFPDFLGVRLGAFFATLDFGFVVRFFMGHHPVQGQGSYSAIADKLFLAEHDVIGFAINENEAGLEHLLG